MIESISKEQEDKIIFYYNKWYDKFHSLEFDDVKARKFVKWLYKFIGEPEPVIVILDSPLSVQLAANELDSFYHLMSSQLGSQLRSQLSSRLGSQLDSQLYSRLSSQLSSRLGSQLRSQLDSQLDSQLGSRLGSQLGSQLRSHLGSQLYSRLGSRLGSQLGSQLDSQLDSQLGSQLYSRLGSQLSSQLRSQLRSQLYSRLGSQLSSQLDSQLDSQLGSQLSSQLSSQLDSQLYSRLGSQLDSQLYSQLGSQLSSKSDSKKIKYYDFDWWGDTSWYGYLCYYDYLYNEIFPDTKIPLFEEYLKLSDSNINFLLTFEKIAFISRPPTYINFNEKNELHQTNDKAVFYADGYGEYFVKGINFDKELFDKVFINKNISSEEIISLSNSEQKAVIIEELGFEKIFSQLNNKTLVDSQIRSFNKKPDRPVNYELYEVGIIESIKSKVLKVEWYEKDGVKRQTILGVPNNMTDAIEAVAWTCYKTKDEWEEKLLWEA